MADPANDPESYKRQKTHTNLDGSKSEWTGGYLKEFDVLYPEAFDELKLIFDTLGSEELMTRCTKKLTQTINESLHFKLWRQVLMFKYHGHSAVFL